MLKKKFLLILFLFLSSCGYEAIHSKKNSINYDFFIEELTFVGNRNINLKIKEKINNYTLNEKDKKFTLIINSSQKKIILAKDISGNPTNFKSTIIINVKVLMKNNFKNNLQMIENFNYNNNSNKFELKRYEREITNNLSEAATDKLIFKLSNIQ